jgi:poly(beta-D-mannuronate) lyase
MNPYIHPPKFALILSLTFFIFSNEASAKKIKVNSVAELSSAIKTSVKGDTIVMKNDTYKNGDAINVKSEGLVILAETPGGVTFTGNTCIKVTGNFNEINGFQFLDGDVGSEKEKVISITGHHNKITQCNFKNITSHNYIHVEEGAQYNELSYCNFEDKPAVHNAGPAIQITTSENSVSHTWIHHCSFLHFKGDGGDFGNEPIRIGLGKEQNNTSGTIIEYCYFEDLGLGDSESISVKSTYNVIRYNTFNHNPLGQLTFRTGNRNIAYGNYFFNSGGIRIKEGQYHMVYNNYFQGEGDPKYATLNLMNFKLNQKTKLGLPLDNILIYNNTFYNPGNIELGGEGPNPPTKVYFTNNIFFKTSGNLFFNTNNNVTFQNNIFFGGATVGAELKPTELKIADPGLIPNTLGWYTLSSKSLAINNSIDLQPSILKNPEVETDSELILDIEKQQRTSKKDLGCDEFSKEKALNHPLKDKEVGPDYLK